ncbi:MAG: phage major capsid protein [Chloroflexi bacterium]|nr:phage major capsid protein [Chloroflexota bacterium]
MLTRIVQDRVYDFSHVVGGRIFMGLYTIALGHGNDVYGIIRMPYSAKVVRFSIGTIPDDEEIVVEFGERGEGQGLVGDFRNFVQLFERRGVTVKVSDSHSDFFIKGKQAIRADMRVALVIYRPAAFVELTDLNT